MCQPVMQAKLPGIILCKAPHMMRQGPRGVKGGGGGELLAL